MRIIFFGTSSFAAHVLEHLTHRPSIQIEAVVTRPDRPQGRSLRLSFSAVKQEALRLLPKTPLFQPEKASTEEFSSALQKFVPDLFIVVAYGEIIKQNLLSLPRYGCINIHASLLPRYRGAAPIQRCLMAGDKETGITIIEMVRGMDAGPMIERLPVAVSESLTFGELEQMLRIAACEALDKAIEAILEGKVVKEEQDQTAVTFAPKIVPEEEKIEWNWPAEKIHNLVRALSPAPGAWCHIHYGDQVRRLKIKRSSVRHDVSGAPGQILLQTKDTLVVACGTEALQLLEIQLEGKKSLPVADFLRGLAQFTLS